MKTCAPTGILRAALLVAVLTFAASAAATPVTVFFDGPESDGLNRGLFDPSDAQTAGVPVISPMVFDADGTLAVVNQTADGTVLPNAPGPNFQITSEFTVKNVFGNDIVGDTFLLFTTAANRDVTTANGTFTTTYDQSGLGITIDEAQGWVVSTALDPTLGTLYYAGILLKSGTFAADEEVVIDVTYFLTDPQLFPDGLDQRLGLPKLGLFMGYTPVPEPGTALLLGLGLTALGVARRKQH